MCRFETKTFRRLFRTFSWIRFHWSMRAVQLPCLDSLAMIQGYARSLEPAYTVCAILAFSMYHYSEVVGPGIRIGCEMGGGGYSGLARGWYESHLIPWLNVRRRWGPRRSLCGWVWWGCLLLPYQDSSMSAGFLRIATRLILFNIQESSLALQYARDSCAILQCSAY